MDSRWQLVLGTLGEEDAPFGQGSLVRFRERMVAHDLDRKLVDRTVALAKASGAFGWQKLKAALDSSPLLGAGRVEDTWNLLGRAIRRVVDAVCVATGREFESVVDDAQLDLLDGPSLKAALDINWDEPGERNQALTRLVDQAVALQRWVIDNVREQAERPPVSTELELLEALIAQDIEPDPSDPSGTRVRIRQGTAKDRIPSVGDPEMRHGRKSRSKKFVGYKRHVASVPGANLIVGAEVLPANVPEHRAVPRLVEDVGRHGDLQTVAVDRGYLHVEAVDFLSERGIDVECKPWRSSNRQRFSKDEFDIDLEARQVSCPAGQTATYLMSASTRRGTARFNADTCNRCELKAQCTASKLGRTVSIHALEPLFVRLREMKATPAGRDVLRERVDVEHALARVGRIQGPKARYRGARKNTLDVRRAAAINNLQTIQRLRQAA